MNHLTPETAVPLATVFLQGLLSFFSPCVLPLLPMYFSYLSGGTARFDENGRMSFDRGRVMLNTVFFALGVNAAFFILGLGLSAAGIFFRTNRLLFARIGGVIMILFGLYQLGVFGNIRLLNKERRLPLKLNQAATSPFSALIFGFVFSFSWTPCIGPALSSVLLMAASASTAGKGFLLIGVYTVGFVLPFIVTGFFTSTILAFLKKHQKIVKVTVKVGGVLMILMGVMMITGIMNGITGYLSTFGG